MQSVKDYFSDNTYDKNVSNNYMHHHEYISSLKDKILSINSENIDILDLGCGNGLFSKLLLNTCKINSYTGVDISDYYLNEAKNNLSFIENVNFICSDILDFLLTNKNKFDIIISSFSIHHVDSRKKETIFDYIKTSLKNKGKFLFIDEYIEEHSGRDEFILKYTDHIKSWEKYTEIEYKNTVSHVVEHDFPEKISSYIKMWNGVHLVLNKFEFQVNITFFK